MTSVIQPRAVSADGRTVALEAPLGTPLAPGGFGVVATEPPLFAQVTGTGIAVRDIDGRRTTVLEGTAAALGGTPGGFGATAIAPATPGEIASWAAASLPADGLDIGAL